MISMREALGCDDLREHGHVCGPQRDVDLVLLSHKLAPLQPIEPVDAVVMTRKRGICTYCRVRPVSIKPRKSKTPRRYCDRCTRAAIERCVKPRGTAGKWA